MNTFFIRPFVKRSDRLDTHQRRRLLLPLLLSLALIATGCTPPASAPSSSQDVGVGLDLGLELKAVAEAGPKLEQIANNALKQFNESVLNAGQMRQIIDEASADSQKVIKSAQDASESAIKKTGDTTNSVIVNTRNQIVDAAKNIGEETRSVIAFAGDTAKGLEQFTVQQGMCAVDFVGARLKSVARLPLERLHAIALKLQGKEYVMPPIRPVVCGMVPNSVNLTQKENGMYEIKEGTLTANGFNFTEDNKPNVVIIDANNNVVGNLEKKPQLTSSGYSFILNLQGIELASGLDGYYLGLEFTSAQIERLGFPFLYPTRVPPTPMPTAIPTATPTPPPTTPPEKTAEFTIDEHHNAQMHGGGRCWESTFQYVVEAGWKIDTSKGDTGHSGITLLEWTPSSKGNGSVEGSDWYNRLNDTTVEVRFRLCHATGFLGVAAEGSFLKARYRVHLTQ